MKLSGVRHATGAIHPFGTNFRRNPRYDIVHRMRHLVKVGMYTRPAWLTAVENAPPPELYNMRVITSRKQNPYPKLVAYILKRYPDLRFQDLYVEGNDWTIGNDTYRDDHPVMQFAARQLRLMNEGHSRQDAFEITREWFEERRQKLELQQKLDMAATVSLANGLDGNLGSHGPVRPLFPTGQAYLLQQVADKQARVLQELKRHLDGKVLHARQQQIADPEIVVTAESMSFVVKDGQISVPAFSPEISMQLDAGKLPTYKSAVAQKTRSRIDLASEALRLAVEITKLRKQALVGETAAELSLQDLETLARTGDVEGIVAAASAASKPTGIIRSKPKRAASAAGAKLSTAAPADSPAALEEASLLKQSKDEEAALAKALGLETPIQAVDTPSEAPAKGRRGAKQESVTDARMQRVAALEQELAALMGELEISEQDGAGIKRNKAKQPIDHAPRAAASTTATPMDHWSKTPTAEWDRKTAAAQEGKSAPRPTGEEKPQRVRKSAVRQEGEREVRANSVLSKNAAAAAADFKDEDDDAMAKGGDKAPKASGRKPRRN